jgi:hypothetical protein
MFEKKMQTYPKAGNEAKRLMGHILTTHRFGLLRFPGTVDWVRGALYCALYHTI